MDALKKPTQSVPAGQTSQPAARNSFAATLKKASAKTSAEQTDTSAANGGASFLKKDFMMGGTSFKDWDKDDGAEVEHELETIAGK